MEEWRCPDSGASHHVMSDIRNLSLTSDYFGNGKVHMGNEEGLSISYLGHLNFRSPSRSFILRNLLHVPQITKNLISVGKCASDNHVFIEFHSNFCLVKDLVTRVVLLRGSLHNGLYKFHLGKPLSAPEGSAACLHAGSSISSLSSPQDSTTPSFHSLNQWHLGSDQDRVKEIIWQLNKQFSLKDLGILSYFLGIEVVKTSNHSLLIKQTKYIQDSLVKTKMNLANALPIPMSTGVKLSSKDGDAFEDVTLYRSTGGAFLYLTITRPDIAYGVNRVCQFMQTPLLIHWKAVKRILRYLIGTLHYGVSLSAYSLLSLHVYCDADWGNDIDDRRSTSGFYWFLGNSPVSWSSKKQTVVSRTSTKAEYRSSANAT